MRGHRGGLEDVHRLFDAVFGRTDLVMIADAAEAYAAALFSTASPAGETRRNSMAEVLSRTVTLYSLSDDGQVIRALAGEDLRSGRFVDGGRVLAFRDGREPIRRLAVARSDLDEAIRRAKAH